MADSRALKRGDTYPFLRATLTDGDDEPIDLTGSTVRLTLRTKGTSPTTVVDDVVVDIIDDVGGRVEYEWQAADTATTTSFDGEFKITWGDGEVTFVPTEGFFTITVNPNLRP
jgi:hypothetical protein